MHAHSWRPGLPARHSPGGPIPTACHFYLPAQSPTWVRWGTTARRPTCCPGDGMEAVANRGPGRGGRIVCVGCVCVKRLGCSDQLLAPTPARRAVQKPIIVHPVPWLQLPPAAYKLNVALGATGKPFTA